MSYVQRFGINRNSPMNMVSPMKMMGGEDNQANNVIEKQNVKAQEEKSSSWLDWVQDGLTVAGAVPLIGNVADGVNTLVSGGRAIHAGVTGSGDVKRHLGNMALNAGSMIPAVGQGLAGAKIAAKVTDKAMKVGKAAKTGKKIKRGMIGAEYSGLMSTADSEDYNDKIIPAGYVPKPKES